VPICYFHTSVYDTLAEESETYSAYVEGNYEFSPMLKFHGEAYYYHNKLPDIVVNPSDALGSFPMGSLGCSGAVTGVGNATSCGAPNTAGYSVSGLNPAVASFMSQHGYTAAQVASVIDPANPGRVFLNSGSWRPFGMGGNPLSTNKGADRQVNTRDSYRVVGEFSGALGRFLGFDINYSLAGVYQTTRYQIQTTDMSVNKLQAALNGFGGPSCTGTVAGANGCRWFNPFSSAIASNLTTGDPNTLTYNAALANDPAMVAWLYEDLALDRHTDLYVGDFLLNGSGGIELWGGPVAWAVGAQYRKTVEENDVTDNNQVGRTLFSGVTVEALNPCPTPGVQDCSQASRTGPLVYRRAVGGIRRDYKREYPSLAYFAEVNLPIFDRLNAAFAVRHEQFESDLVDNTNKIWVGSGSIKWQVTDNVFLRGTAGNTFSNDAGQEQDVLRTNSTTTATFPTWQISGVTTLSSPTPSLKPEKGFNYNVGGGVNIGNFRGTIDYYNIKITNIARTVGADAVVAGLVKPGVTGPAAVIDCASELLDVNPEFGGPSVRLAGFTGGDQHAYCSSFAGGNPSLNTDPDGAGPLTALMGLGAEMRYYTGANGGDQTTSGIDASAAYRFDEAFGGILTVGADVTYILTYKIEPFLVNGVQIAAGYDGVGLINEATGRNGQRIARWRGNLSFNYTRGRHNLNWSTRVVSSLLDDSATRYTSSVANNANIADATGVTNASLCPTGGLILDQEGEVPAGAGTGLNGGSTPSNTTATSATLGYQAGCNAQILSGRKIPTTFNTDVTYRVQLPWDTSLSFTVYNLFDKDPPFARCNSCGYGYDAFVGNPLGRNYKLQVTKRF
jgi:iron complex outermembrane recepter protein